jgi:hypothetical protein
MLSTRNVGGKGDEDSNFTVSKEEVEEDDDSRGYHHDSYRRDGSIDYKRWLVYISTTVIVGYLLWTTVMTSKVQPLIEVDTVIPIVSTLKLPVEVQIDSLRQIPVQEKVPSKQYVIAKPPLQYEPDAMGCLHSVPELDVGKHIVPPPAGPISLVCCQSTKGEIKNRTRTVLHFSTLFSYLCCCQERASRSRKCHLRSFPVIYPISFLLMRAALV